jgi:hypothetical protein
MDNHQAKLLSALAKEIKSEPKDRSNILVSLTSAKIITKKENLTSAYSNLKRVIPAVK